MRDLSSVIFVRAVAGYRRAVSILRMQFQHRAATIAAIP
jgi:hypothetical protein